ncbi:MAG: hypothetical protein ABSG14_10815 [Verrucomicrobiia bacterium]|jgi:hypothetical protein
MNADQVYHQLLVPNDSKLALVVLDGLGEIAGWDGQDRFTGRTANLGSLGRFEAKYLIRHMQANAKRLDKFGA